MPNFYANILMVGEETTPEVRMHLGKNSTRSTSVDGNQFDSFASMINFLRHNEKRVTITSESGVPYTVKEFEEEFRSSEHKYTAVPHEYLAERHWIDNEGFLMSSGVWF